MHKVQRAALEVLGLESCHGLDDGRGRGVSLRRGGEVYKQVLHGSHGAGAEEVTM